MIHRTRTDFTFDSLRSFFAGGSRLEFVSYRRGYYDLAMTKQAHGAAYPAERAAGLAGIPLSTLHYWARTALWVPSVSAVKEKRWSYADVLALRLIDWLRHEKNESFPATTVQRIRKEFAKIEQLGERLETESCRVWVDKRGGIRLGDQGDAFVPLPPGMAQRALDLGDVDLLAAFSSPSGRVGPDLRRPRPTLRIIPGKLAGEPHVQETRIPTIGLASMMRRHFEPDQIMELYPGISRVSIQEAVELEDQILSNSGYLAA